MIEKKSLWNFILSKNHIIPSPVANKIGIPVIRTILSNLLIMIRRFKNCKPETSYEKKLIKDGIVVIPNFLPENEFNQLKKEFNKIILQNNNINDGSKIRSVINKENYVNFKAIENFAKNKQLIRLISVGEGRKVFKKIEKLILEKSFFGDSKKDTDVNLKFHADVHFHSHKVLYYMDDVVNENGPFNYCVGSHKNNFNRLWFELKRGQLKDSHIENWRLDNHHGDEFFGNYYNKLMKNKYEVTGKANTLIIANVHGFHRRGDAIEGSNRSLIRIPFRYNPLGNQKLSHDSYSGNLFS
tara:strand:+ start:263 stop:1156 length:894 start_codon:yes stop_codon:yes gene_type:complete